MAVLLPNLGIDWLTQLVLGRSAYDSLTVRLYMNNHVPALGDVAGDYTECAMSGYAAASLVPADWTGSTSAGVADYTYPTITFSFDPYGTSPQTVYGYYVTNGAGDPVWAELLGTPYVVPAGGGELLLDLTWQDHLCA